MGWLHIDLSGERVASPHDPSTARARRIDARRRLVAEVGLSGSEALALADEIRRLELVEAAESLHLLRS